MGRKYGNGGGASLLRERVMCLENTLTRQSTRYRGITNSPAEAPPYVTRWTTVAINAAGLDLDAL